MRNNSEPNHKFNHVSSLLVPLSPSRNRHSGTPKTLFIPARLLVGSTRHTARAPETAP